VNTWPTLWVTNQSPGWMYGRDDSFRYSNPFYAAPAFVATTAVPAGLDYSHEIEPPPADLEEYEGAPPDEATQQAIAHFDAARSAFKQGDYDVALKRVDEAIGLLPSDATLHEFRGLVLFAQGEFQQAAATIYAVLAVGPGWSWETLVGLYADTSTYTEQLRALEGYVRANPTDAAAMFLLAYHYITMGHLTEAVTMLERVSKKLPDDQLTDQLLTALRQDAPSG